MSEDLADYLANLDIRVRYLHSEIDALDRMEILRGLRLADFDVLVGINLLREGLDLPEVSLVAILDADKEGFLRSERSLMQIAGRAARHASGRVILYADRITDSIRGFMDETERRRKMQQAYNINHGITPSTIEKSVEEVMAATRVADSKKESYSPSGGRKTAYTKMELEEQLDLLEKEMLAAAQNLEFERAADIRDEIALLKGETMKGGGNYRRRT
jgi:excinuclease ABC subunit B